MFISEYGTLHYAFDLFNISLDTTLKAVVYSTVGCLAWL